ncbi:MAG: tetratricopeptide repeat protein [Cyclobacteriaceae bacterium]
MILTISKFLPISRLLCLFLLLSLAFPKYTNGKNPKIDSLESQLDNAKNDSTRFNILYDLYYYYYETDLEVASKWAEEVIALKKTITDKRLLAKVYSLIADYKGVMGNHIDSKNHYQKALELNIELEDTMGLSGALFNLGVTHDFLGDYVSALSYYQQSLDLAEYLHDREGEAEILGNIGVLYSNQQDYDNSIRYFQESLKINQELKDQEAICLDLGNLGAVYHDYGLADNDTAKINLAIDHYKQALDIQKKLNNTGFIGWIKANLGLMYIEQQDFERGMEHLLDALNISISTKDKIAQATAYGNIGEAYFYQKNYQQALTNYQKSHQLGIESNDKLTTLAAYEGLSQIYEKLGNYKLAYEYHEKFKAAQDSLYNIDRNTKFNELMALYDSEKKELQIQNLERDREFHALELKYQKSQKQLYLITASIMAVLSLLLFFFYLDSRNTKVKLEKNNEDLVRYQKELSDLNTTKDRFFAIIAHDLRGAITSFQGIGQVIKNHLAKNRLERIGVVADRIDRSASRLNHLLDNLLNWSVTQLDGVPFAPRKLLLVNIVEQTIDPFQQSAQAKNITISIDLPKDLYVLADPNGLSVILRNLLDNAVKFTGEDGKVHLKAEAGHNEVVVSISDNGIGIPQEKIDQIFDLDPRKSISGASGEKGTGLGLLLCQEFIKLHKGTIWVESKPNSGSTFYFKIPIPSES